MQCFWPRTFWCGSGYSYPNFQFIDLDTDSFPCLRLNYKLWKRSNQPEFGSVLNKELDSNAMWITDYAIRCHATFWYHDGVSKGTFYFCSCHRCFCSFLLGSIQKARSSKMLKISPAVNATRYRRYGTQLPLQFYQKKGWKMFRISPVVTAHASRKEMGCANH